MKEQLLNELNEQQKQVVAAPLSNMLVIAGAGSGKTRTLVHRIAWLIEVEMLEHYNILAVTFTNKAAKEMRARVEKLLGIPTYRMWVGTFHGLAHRMLRMHYSEAGLKQNFQILDSVDQLRLIKRLLKEKGIPKNILDERGLQGFINSCKDNAWRYQDVARQAGNEYRQKRRLQLELYQLYEQACQEGDFVDFAELLLRCYEMLRDNTQMRDQYTSQFKQLLVDEFQDTNRIQYLWIKLLTGNSNNLMAVGDDDQSIYAWRGAKIENIQSFENDFPASKLFKLEQNYRSTDVILRTANSLISNNQGRMGKNLHTADSGGEPIMVYRAFNPYDEAKFIVSEIELQHRKHSYRYQDCAVLYRSNAQSRILEESFLRLGIPYRIYGGRKFYERAEVKNAVAYLRLLVNRNDDASFDRVVNLPVRGVGSRSLEVIQSVARANGLSLWDAADKLINEGNIKGRAASGIRNFMQCIAELVEATANLTLSDKVEMSNKISGLLDFYQTSDKSKGESRAENLNELVEASQQFAPQDLKLDPLQEFVNHAALEAGEAQENEHVDSVQIMTLHAAKGLEFNFVTICGVEDGILPHQNSLAADEQVEEERRLMYVGITRAMKKLLITWSEERAFAGRKMYQKQSRFLQELPAETVHNVKLENNFSFNQGQTFDPMNQDIPNHFIPNSDFRLGEKVRHQTYGIGVVENFEGSGDNARLLVKFSAGDSKWLVLQYAKLQRLN